WPASTAPSRGRWTGTRTAPQPAPRSCRATPSSGWRRRAKGRAPAAAMRAWGGATNRSGSNAGWCWRPARTTRTGASVPGPGASRRGRSVDRARGQVAVVAPVALLEDARRHGQVVDDPRGDAALIVLPRHLGRGAGSAGDGDRFGADRAEHLPARPPVLDQPVGQRLAGAEVAHQGQ